MLAWSTLCIKIPFCTHDALHLATLAYHGITRNTCIEAHGGDSAGNTYNPSKLFEKGQFSSPDSSATTTRATTSQVAPAVRMQGRGGAGNFGPWESTGATESRQDADREALWARAEQDVEAGLARPGQAYLGPKEKQKDAPTSELGVPEQLQS